MTNQCDKHGCYHFGREKWDGCSCMQEQRSSKEQFNEFKELCDRLRFTWADNGSGYNSDFTKDMNAAADAIERLQQHIVRCQQAAIERASDEPSDGRDVLRRLLTLIDRVVPHDTIDPSITDALAYLRGPSQPPPAVHAAHRDGTEPVSRLAGDIDYCLAKINSEHEVHEILARVRDQLRGAQTKTVSPEPGRLQSSGLSAVPDAENIGQPSSYHWDANGSPVNYSWYGGKVNEASVKEIVRLRKQADETKDGRCDCDFPVPSLDGEYCATCASKL